MALIIANKSQGRWNARNLRGKSFLDLRITKWTLAFSEIRQFQPSYLIRVARSRKPPLARVHFTPTSALGKVHCLMPNNAKLPQGRDLAGIR